MKLSHLSVAVFSAIALAACGGGSDNAVDNSHVKKDPPKKEEPKKELPPIVADQLKGAVDFSNAPGIDDDKAFSDINGKEATVLAFNLSAKQQEKYGYVQNSKLLDKDGKTTTQGIYYKDSDGTFKEVVEKDGYVYKQGTKELEKKNALKAADLYQKAVDGANEGNYLSKISAFGNTYDVAKKSSLPKSISFDNLEANKVVDGKVVYTVNSQVKQLGSDNNSVKNVDKKENYLNVAQDIPVAGYKAYKQAYSTVVVPTKLSDGEISKEQLISSDIDAEGVSVIGVQNLGMPETGTAVYKGKAFTAASTADLTLDVQFGKDKYLASAVINNRTSNADNSALESLKTAAPKALWNGGAIRLDLVQASDGAKNSEYDLMDGKFYGASAEEVAGALKKKYNDETVGGFAASSK